MKVKASWQGTVLAESEATVEVEGNHYFPPESVQMKYLEGSEHHTHCPWKGEAHYYDVVVDGKRNENAAWYYPQTKPLANKIQGHLAFWNGVKVETLEAH